MQAKIQAHGGTSIFSKVLFGLESAELTPGAMRALDVFHLKCLRKCLKLKTTYIEGANTNQEVFRQASGHLKPGEVIKPLSAIYLERKQKLFCKVAAAEDKDPIRSITFKKQTMQPLDLLNKRVGRPKHKWAQVETRRLWEIIRQTQQRFHDKNLTQAQLSRGIDC